MAYAGRGHDGSPEGCGDSVLSEATEGIEEEYDFLLPLPPSVNDRYAIRHGRYNSRPVLSKSHRDYFEKTDLLLRGQSHGHGVRLSRDRPYLLTPRAEDWVTVTVIYCGMTRRRDPDNGLKAICDALESGRVFKNDNQVDAVSAVRSRAWKKEKMCLVTVSWLRLESKS